MKSIFEKKYITEAKAYASAEKAGLDIARIALIKNGNMWMVTELPEAKLTPRQELDAWIISFQARIEIAQTEDDIQKLYEALNERSDELADAVMNKLDEDIGIRAEEIEATRSAISEPKSPNASKAQKEWIHASSVERPTKLVWAIADSMPGASRAEVQAACVKAGIASGTARTQYQHWFKTLHDSENEARAQIVDGKLIPATKGEK